MKKLTLKIFHQSTLFFICILLSACHETQHNITQKTYSHMTDKQISIPNNMHPIGHVLKNTVYIGTVDHPTIEGGIINLANGERPNQDIPNDFGTHDFSKNEIRPRFANNVIEKTHNNSFDDTWINSHKLQDILETAARTGKLNYILSKSNKMKLPPTVAFIPIVESKYQDNAISSQGAAGLWQLMPNTARDFGVTDCQRFEFIPSTDAALYLLKNLHQEFGNWELAFAAYNAGSGRIKRALIENPEAKTINDLNIPQETKQYINRIKQINTMLMTYET